MYTHTHKRTRAFQKLVEAQYNRRKFGRDVRPLRCVNTEWLGGVDWRRIEAAATGMPAPTGVCLECKLSESKATGMPAPTGVDLGYGQAAASRQPRWIMHLCFHAFMHSFMHSFIHSFICSFINV